MIEQAINRLNLIVEKAPSLLAQISEEKISEKPAPNKWSKKEILGHLIDSATNNHQRIIRGQFEAIPEIQYDQNEWNKYSFYQQIDSQKIISFWTIYNLQLIEIIKRIPKENLKKQVKVGQNVLTLENLTIDYVAHLEHHLKQLIDY
jgi:DinB superfamily